MYELIPGTCLQDLLNLNSNHQVYIVHLFYKPIKLITRLHFNLTILKRCRNVWKSNSLIYSP